MGFRIAKTLGQKRAIPVLTFPLGNEFTHPRSKTLAPQIWPTRLFQNQKSSQLHHQLQTLRAGYRIPPHGFIPILQMPCRRAPYQHAGQFPVLHHQLAKPVSSLAPGSQAMLPTKGFLGSPPVLRGMRNLHFQSSLFPLRNIPAMC